MSVPVIITTITAIRITTRPDFFPETRRRIPKNMKQFLSVTVAIIALLSFTARAQTLSLNEVMSLGLDCQIQQNESTFTSTTTNLEINTQSLLELVAADQGFTLPPHAKLWLGGNGFAVLRQDNTIFTNIDTNILSVTYVSTVLKSKLIQNRNLYQDTVDGTSVVTLIYNGSTISFNLNFIGDQTFYNQANYAKTTNNAVVSTSFSGRGFGGGTCGGKNMVVTGFLNGNYTFSYTTGNAGPMPPGGGDGAFPSPGLSAVSH